MLNKVSAFACMTALTCMVAAPASSQVMTSSEILKRLQMQAQSGQTGGLQGTTRGLTLDYNEEPSVEQPSAVVGNIAPPVVETVAPPVAIAPAAPSRVTVAAPTYEPVPVAPKPQMVALPEPAAPAAQPVETTVAAVPTYEAGTSTQVFENVEPVFAEPETVARSEPVMPAPVPTYEPQAQPAPTLAAVEPPAPVTTAAVPTYEAGASTQIFESADPEPQIAATASARTMAPVVDAKPIPASARPAAYKAVVEEQRVDLKVYFEWNSASLRSEAISQLSELCTAIRAIPDGNVLQIIGHTDKSGKADYNLYLSQARAREVKRHLVEECSIPEDSLQATGEGERQAPANTPGNSPDERRVEVQLIS